VPGAHFVHDFTVTALLYVPNEHELHSFNTLSNCSPAAHGRIVTLNVNEMVREPPLYNEIGNDALYCNETPGVADEPITNVS
jgi:hypothetical protein